MELIQHTIRVQNGQAVTIAPLGDLQYDGPNGAMAGERLKAHLAEAQSRNAYYVGTGDYVDFMSPSNRVRLANAGLYDTARRVIRDKAYSLVGELLDDYLTPTIGRWLGLVHGHHYSDTSTGETTDELLAAWLHTQYLGTCAYVVLDFVSDDASERHGRVVLWVHHGNGNGKPGHAIRKLEGLVGSWDADVFIMGHDCKLETATMNRIYPKAVDGILTLEHKKVCLVGSGAWSRAYRKGHTVDGKKAGCYVEAAMLTPAALGGAFITIRPQWTARRWDPSITVEV